MRQKKTQNSTAEKVRVEIKRSIPGMTLVTTAPAVTAADIRRIVAKLKGEI